MKLLRSWLISALAIYLVSLIMPQSFYVFSIGTALKAAVVLGILNWTLKPILQILSFPLTLLTLGLFRWVVNGAVLLVLDRVMPGMYIRSLFIAIIASLIISFVTSFFDKKEMKHRS